MPLYTQCIFNQLKSPAAAQASGFPIDWDADTFKTALFASSASTFINAASSYTYFSTFASAQVTGTGYVASGVATSGVTLTYASHNPTKIKFDADDVAWDTATITARYAVIYKVGATNADPLICWVDFGADQTSTSGTFQIQWNSAGIVEISIPWS